MARCRPDWTDPCGRRCRPDSSLPVRVWLDGQLVEDAYGSDVHDDGTGSVNDQRTYQLIRQPGPIVERRFEIEFLGAEVETYCFTFG